MDNLTHTLVGVMLSRAGLGRLAPRAGLAVVLAANGPDIDIVTAFGGSLSYLHYHRGITHAVIAVPVLAVLAAAVARLSWRRRKGSFRWGRTYLAALAGLATHPLMDFTNTYGIRAWMPFTDAWYSWDIMFIVDPWVWAALLLSLAGAALGRLIAGEIGDRPGAGRGAAVLALLFLVAWWGAREAAHRRAIAMLEAHVYGPESQAAPPRRVAAFPSPTSPLAWRGFVETDGFYQIIPLNVLRPMDPSRGRFYYKPEPAPALKAALRTRTATEFARFARYKLELLDRRPDGYRVLLTDFRFFGERPRAFTCTIELDGEMRVVREGFSF